LGSRTNRANFPKCAAIDELSATPIGIRQNL
jgi:hypothetical protein